jgi:hypothetical protein
MHKVCMRAWLGIRCGQAGMGYQREDPIQLTLQLGDSERADICIV